MKNIFFAEPAEIEKMDDDRYSQDREGEKEFRIDKLHECPNISNQNFSNTPKPNRAKSYFTGSEGSNVFNFLVSSAAAFQSS